MNITFTSFKYSPIKIWNVQNISFNFFDISLLLELRALWVKNFSSELQKQLNIAIQCFNLKNTIDFCRRKVQILGFTVTRNRRYLCYNKNRTQLPLCLWFQYCYICDGGHRRGDASGERDGQAGAVPRLSGRAQRRHDHRHRIVRRCRLLRLHQIRWRRPWKCHS